MLADLRRRTSPSGRGRLLDLACGTFPLRDRFADVWAVDAEADMTHVIRAKAEATGDATHVRAVTARAEELDVEAGSVELIVIGNAFHRLRRDLVAQRALTWLEPGGCLALCWATSPWAGGPLGWQQAFGSFLPRWQEAVGATSRIPPGAEQQPQADTAGTMLLSSVTDPYQGRETKYRLTRGILRELRAVGDPGLVRVLTKSPAAPATSTCSPLCRAPRSA